MIVVDFTELLRNGQTPLATYRAMMRGLLIALDKQPRIMPVNIRETWRQLMAKCLHPVTGQKAKAAYGIDQLSRGVKTGIEGRIHAMCVLW